MNANKNMKIRENAAGGSCGAGGMAVALDGGSIPVKRHKISTVTKKRRKRYKIGEGVVPGMERSNVVVQDLQEWLNDVPGVDFYHWMTGDADDVETIISWIERRFDVEMNETEDHKGRLVYTASSSTVEGSYNFRITFDEDRTDIEIVVDVEQPSSTQVSESSHEFDEEFDDDDDISNEFDNEEDGSDDLFYVVVVDGDDMWVMKLERDDRRWEERHVRDLIGDSSDHRIGGAGYMTYLSPTDIINWLNKDYSMVFGPYESPRDAMRDPDVRLEYEELTTRRSNVGTMREHRVTRQKPTARHLVEFTRSEDGDGGRRRRRSPRNPMNKAYILQRERERLRKILSQGLDATYNNSFDEYMFDYWPDFSWDENLIVELTWCLDDPEWQTLAQQVKAKYRYDFAAQHREAIQESLVEYGLKLTDLNWNEKGEFGSDKMNEGLQNLSSSKIPKRNPVAKNAHLTTRSSAGFHTGKKYDREKSKAAAKTEIRNSQTLEERRTRRLLEEYMGRTGERMYISKSPSGDHWVLTNADTDEVIDRRFTSKHSALIYGVRKGFNILDDEASEQHLNKRFNIKTSSVNTKLLQQIADKGPFDDSQIVDGELRAELLDGFTLRGAAAAVSKAIDGARAAMRGDTPIIIIGKDVFVFEKYGLIGVVVRQAQPKT